VTAVLGNLAESSFIRSSLLVTIALGAQLSLMADLRPFGVVGDLMLLLALAAGLLLVKSALLTPLLKMKNSMSLLAKGDLAAEAPRLGGEPAREGAAVRAGGGLRQPRNPRPGRL